MPRKAKPAEVAAGHVVYDDGVLRMTATSSPPGMAIAGEIDEGTYPALVGKLEELAGSADIHINLAGVEYCDLAGLRAIIQLAGASRGSQARRRLVLHEVPQHLLAVLGILGWESTPGLVIDRLAPRR
jgi:anti-anti-sigma factor